MANKFIRIKDEFFGFKKQNAVHIFERENEEVNNSSQNFIYIFCMVFILHLHHRIVSSSFRRLS